MTGVVADAETFAEFSDDIKWAIAYARKQGLRLPLRVTIRSYGGEKLRFKVIKAGVRGKYTFAEARGPKCWKLIFPAEVRMKDKNKRLQAFTVTHDDNWRDMPSAVVH